MLRRELENGLGARGPVEQGATVLERVSLGRRRQLVDEALDHKDAMRRPDAAPERSGHAWRLLADVIHPDVGKRIWRLRGALHGVHVEPFDHGEQLVDAGCPHDPERLGKELVDHAGHDGGARDPVGPGDRHAVRIQAGGDAIIVIRPVHVVLNVFFPAPHHLHRAGDLLGDLHGPGNEVHLEPPAEPAAQEMSRAARPCFAAHVASATTATASSRRTTCCTPGTAFAWVSSTLASLPPNTGQPATAANFMPGSRTSMPNCAVPSTLSGVSSRFTDVPISLKSFGSLSVTSRGTGRRAARSTRAP